jgi:hypothetical protein
MLARILVVTIPPLIFVLVPAFIAVTVAAMEKKTVLPVLMTVMIVVVITAVTLGLERIMIHARKIASICALFFVQKIVIGIHVFILQTAISARV